MKVKKIFIFNLISLFFLFSLDRLSKFYILQQNNLKPNFNIEVTSFLDFNLVWNQGIAFGLLAFDDILIYNFISFIIALVITFLIILSFREESFRRYVYLLICGGALGNFYDRVVYGAVVDFIDFNYNNFHWFIFNVADIMITVGVLILILSEFLIKDE
ncbi:signal peptidase II [Candidatus Pelagibacter sp.]|uniref:signal peptidase II n=1 Tax=Candidatus Pelagibacter sp. TaxID=2024849 RepID=UPI003F85003A